MQTSNFLIKIRFDFSEKILNNSKLIKHTLHYYGQYSFKPFNT